MNTEDKKTMECECAHEHHHEHGGDEDRKSIVVRLTIAAVLFIAVLVVEHLVAPAFMQNRIVNTVCYLVPYLIVGWDVIKEAFEGLIHGELFGEEFLMVIASAAAFATGENAEGAAVLILYCVGELCQDLAVDRSRKSIKDLMDLTPAYANVEDADGKLRQISPEDLHIGDTAVILPGERIPVDGTILSGTSMIDTSAMTGEPVPRMVVEGGQVVSGCINGEGRFTIRVDKEYRDSTVSKVMELTETAADRKSKTENFITRFARIYTPVVVGLAVLLAVVPPLATGSPFLPWIKRACTFLVISCPCALVISIPLSFFGGIGAAGRNGILIKGSNYLEALTHVKVFVSDKTGTLTKGEFRIAMAVFPDGTTFYADSNQNMGESNHSELNRNMQENEHFLHLLSVAALAERDSTHPIAKSIRTAAGTVPSLPKNGKSEYITGMGMHTVTGDGTEIFAGSRKLLTTHGIDCPEIKEAGSLVYVAENGTYLGTLIIRDSIKPEAVEALELLRQKGIVKSILLTGDSAEAAATVQEALKLNGVLSNLLPQDKTEVLEELLEAMEADEKLCHGKLLYAGDGINDAPVLARADIGVAMGSLGSDAAIEAADVVIMDDDIRRIPMAMDIAKKTVSICRQNIVFALAIKVLFLLLGAFGYANMWMAVFADVGVALLCILNSMRMLRYK